MKHLILLIVPALLMFSCNADPETTEGEGGEVSAEEVARLQSENRDLQAQITEKDSILNETMMLFNEIEMNLAMINLKEDEIRLRSNDVELAEDGKQWILQEINNINYLREANAKKVEELTDILDNKNLEIAEFKKTIENLLNKITVMEEEIEMLRVELQDLDQEYVELLEAYQEQTQIAADMLRELNKGYYAYGTDDELMKNGVLVKEGGFIGIGKKIALKDDFNEDYFTQVDVANTRTIEVTGKKPKFITDHPSTAYEIESNGENHKIIINDPAHFWKVSKYLVIVVD